MTGDVEYGGDRVAVEAAGSYLFLEGRCDILGCHLGPVRTRFEAGVVAVGDAEEPTSGGDVSAGESSWVAGAVDVPVLDYKGRVPHNRGVVEEAPGMYLLGGNLLRARRSSYINGAVSDTEELAAHLHKHLSCRAS